jgi:hypothetical protein
MSSWANRLKTQPAANTTAEANNNNSNKPNQSNKSKDAANTNGASGAEKSAVQSSTPAAAAAASGSVGISSVLKYLLLSLRGHVVDIQLQDKSIWQGLFYTANLVENNDNNAAQSQIILKEAQLQQQPSSSDRNINQFIEKKSISLSEIVTLKASSVQLNPSTSPTSQSGASVGFATDTEISNRPLQMRELQKFEIDAALQAENLLSLDSNNNSAGAGHHGNNWDQFAAWEQMTGKKSDFDFERDYSTKLDRNSDFYKAMEKKAEVLAKQIQTQQTDNIHLAMERNQVAESDINEEGNSVVQFVVSKPLLARFDSNLTLSYNCSSCIFYSRAIQQRSSRP